MREHGFARRFSIVLLERRQDCLVLFESSLRHGAGTVAVLVEGTSITIEDEGPGVPDDRVAGLFERPTDHQAAHGRGLALARRLAESDGGRLELLQRRPPQFRLTLVAAASAATAD